MLARADRTNHFLIAMPSLMDPNFHQTVTYICAHNEEGAMGLVINRPMELHLSDVLEQLDIEATAAAVAHMPVFEGGPVQRERGFVIHRPAGVWDAVALVARGYAGWGAGQLERELAENAWLSGPADVRILFELPSEQRWAAAAASLGVDLTLLSTEAGHA